MLETLLGNSLFRTVIIPMLLILFTVFVDREVSKTKGRAYGQRRFRIWRKDVSGKPLQAHGSPGSPPSTPATVPPVPGSPLIARGVQSGTSTSASMRQKISFAYIPEANPNKWDVRDRDGEAPPEIHRTIEEVCAALQDDTLDDVDLMHEAPGFDFNSVAINLAVGAMGVDVSLLLVGARNPATTVTMLVLHLFTLEGVRNYVSRSLAAMPRSKSRQRNSMLAASLGWIAVALAAFGT